MVPTPRPGSNAHLICPQALRGDDLLTVRHKLRLHGRVWYQQKDDHRVSNRQKTAKKKDL